MKTVKGFDKVKESFTFCAESRVNNTNNNLKLISKLQIILKFLLMSSIHKIEHFLRNPCPKQQQVSPFHSPVYKLIITVLRLCLANGGYYIINIKFRFCCAVFFYIFFAVKFRKANRQMLET